MNQLLQEVTPYISQYGLWIVFFGMMVEGTTMIFVTGVLCYLGMLSFEEALPVAMAGAIVGDQFWYSMGRYYATALLQRFPILQAKTKKLEPTLVKKGNWFAFGGRFVYGGAILFPLTLGTYHYSHSRFTLFDTVGVTLWSFIGIGLGFTLGSSVEIFIGKIDRVWHIILVIFLGVTLIYFFKKYFAKNSINK